MIQLTGDGTPLVGQTRDRLSRPATYKPLNMVTAPRLAGDGASLTSLAAFDLAGDDISLARNNSFQLMVARLWFACTYLVFCQNAYISTRLDERNTMASE